MLLGHGGAQRRRRAVQRLHRIAPVAVRLSCGESETGRHRSALRTATADGGGGLHLAEHNRNFTAVEGGLVDKVHAAAGAVISNGVCQNDESPAGRRGLVE